MESGGSDIAQKKNLYLICMDVKMKAFISSWNVHLFTQFICFMELQSQSFDTNQKYTLIGF